MSVTLNSVHIRVSDPKYLHKHKIGENAFSRDRKLPFSVVLKLLLRKSTKSLQLVLNEWFQGANESATASALSQARQKLSHTAFVELLDESVVRTMYEAGPYEKFHGYRLLAIDGTVLRLPTSKELISSFGTVPYMNGKQKVAGTNVEAKASVLYDVLNEIPLAGSIHRARTNEIKAGIEHLALVGSGDILLADRGFCSFAFFTEILAKNADFVIRIRDNAFHAAHQFFSNTQKKDIVVDVPCPTKMPDIPESLRLRFVRVDLPDGEVEVLATSLLDQKRLPTNIFKQLYYKRWRIETYFQTIKSRLSLENFTGKTREAVLQDFYATLFVSGLETMLCEDATEKLKSKNTVHSQKVNRSISFHAIKSEIMLLIFDPPDDMSIESRIAELFTRNPTLERPDRLKNKERISLQRNERSLRFQKCARKTVF